MACVIAGASITTKILMLLLAHLPFPGVSEVWDAKWAADRCTLAEPGASPMTRGKQGHRLASANLAPVNKTLAAEQATLANQLWMVSKLTVD
jgi:hypothetical protein